VTALLAFCRIITIQSLRVVFPAACGGVVHFPPKIILSPRYYQKIVPLRISVKTELEREGVFDLIPA
jgi:hypothetical protein